MGNKTLLCLMRWNKFGLSDGKREWLKTRGELWPLIIRENDWGSLRTYEKRRIGPNPNPRPNKVRPNQTLVNLINHFVSYRVFTNQPILFSNNTWYLESFARKKREDCIFSATRLWILNVHIIIHTYYYADTSTYYTIINNDGRRRRLMDVIHTGVPPCLWT